MKEREIVELFFDLFRNSKCRSNEGILEGRLRFGLVYKLNPKEQELFNVIFPALQALEYIKVDSDGRFIRLTEKGYDYIYDEDEINRIKNLPWVIPVYGNADWSKAFNKLWKVIGEQNVAPYYLSGPAYLKMVSSLDDSVTPDYMTYIEERRKSEQSTSRINYFKDLLLNLPNDDLRYELFVKIQSYIESSNQGAAKDSGNIEIDMPEWNINPDQVEKESDEERAPRVFISYSWDDNEHENWVLQLATKLKANGVDALLDKWRITPGTRQHHYFEEIGNVDFVICILTPNYKFKAENRKGGVGTEYSLITADISHNIEATKYIPIIRRKSAGDAQAAIPIFLDGVNYVDFDDDSKFDQNFEDLLRRVFNKPRYVEPPLGPKPVFD